MCHSLFWAMTKISLHIPCRKAEKEPSKFLESQGKRTLHFLGFIGFVKFDIYVGKQSSPTHPLFKLQMSAQDGQQTVTVNDVITQAKLSKFQEPLEKAGYKMGDEAKGGLLKLSQEELEGLALKCEMKPGHRARFVRACREMRIKTGLELTEEQAKENEELFLDEFLPVATFLSAIDTKEKPAIVDFLSKSAGSALDLKETFTSMDTNKDGLLDEDEFVTGFAKILNDSNKWLVPYLEYMCKNPFKGMPVDELSLLKTVTAYLKDTFIKEFYPQVQADSKNADLMKQAFATADSNKDGVIDEREYMTNVMVHLFASMDKAVLKEAAKKSKDKMKEEAKKKPMQLKPLPLRRPSLILKVRPVKMGKRLPMRRGRPLAGGRSVGTVGTRNLDCNNREDGKSKNRPRVHHQKQQRMVTQEDLGEEERELLVASTP
eukprot:jgi/Bigna1/125491/aug1.1_g199